MLKQLFTSLFFTLSLFIPAFSAEINVAECVDDCLAHDGFILISGEIEEGDLAVIKAKFAETKPTLAGRYTVNIDSIGGNLYEAFAMGKWFRKHAPSIAVAKDGRCLSSCVFILAAGTRKFPEGKIGIHRPYFTQNPNISLQIAMDKMLIDSANYLKSMNIPASLSEDMFSILPEEMKILSKTDLKKYRLNQNDIVFHEEDALHQSKRLGITRFEYAERMNNLKKSSDLEQCQKIKSVEKKQFCTFQALLNFGLLIPDNSLGSNTSETDEISSKDSEYISHCTEKPIQNNDNDICTAKWIWINITVRDFMKKYPSFQKNTPNFEVLNEEVKRLQVLSSNQFDPRILYTARKNIMNRVNE